MLKFLLTIIAVVGYPLAIVFCLALFGIAVMVQRRSLRTDVWPYILWGLGGAVVLLASLWVGGPRSTVTAGDLAGMAVAVIIGGVSGAAFWFGAIRSRRQGRT
jgi:drug/metabolite transporter (DMT)-like permease